MGKNYINCRKLSQEGFCLAWDVGGTPLSVTLEEFWDNKFNLYERKFFNKDPDKHSGRAKAIFNSEDKFYLEFAPLFFKEGCTSELPRKHIVLEQVEKTLKLPEEYYLLRSKL